MTRKEYLQTEAEDFMNNKILPILSARENKNESDIARVNMKAFLYSVGRIDPFEMICILARELTEEEFEKLIKKGE
jgi:hypothetical protein